jgi:hypothetical protein
MGDVRLTHEGHRRWVLDCGQRLQRAPALRLRFERKPEKALAGVDAATQVCERPPREAIEQSIECVRLRGQYRLRALEAPLVDRLHLAVKLADESREVEVAEALVQLGQRARRLHNRPHDLSSRA